MSGHYKILLFFTMVLCFVINHGLGIKAWCGRNVEGLDQEDKIIRAQPAKIIKGGDPSQPLLDEKVDGKASTGLVSYFCCCAGSGGKEQPLTGYYKVPKTSFSAKDFQGREETSSIGSKTSSSNSGNNSVSHRPSLALQKKNVHTNSELTNPLDFDGKSQERKTKSHRRRDSRNISKSPASVKEAVSLKDPYTNSISKSKSDPQIYEATSLKSYSAVAPITTGFKSLERGAPDLSYSYSSNMHGLSPAWDQPTRYCDRSKAASAQYVSQTRPEIRDYWARRNMEDGDQSSWYDDHSSYRSSPTYTGSEFTTDYDAFSENLNRKLDYNERRGDS